MDCPNGLIERVISLEESHLHMKAELEENTRATKSVKSDTALLVEFVSAYRMTTIVGRALGQFLLWVALVTGGLAATWMAWKSGGKP